jgi:hypothetical protein
MSLNKCIYEFSILIRRVIDETNCRECTPEETGEKKKRNTLPNAVSFSNRKSWRMHILHSFGVLNVSSYAVCVHTIRRLGLP